MLRSGACFVLIFSFAIVWTPWACANALETNVISEPITILAVQTPVIFVPTQTLALQPLMYDYSVDEAQLLNELHTYEWLYIVGQVSHGGLFVLAKPIYNP